MHLLSTITTHSTTLSPSIHHVLYTPFSKTPLKNTSKTREKPDLPLPTSPNFFLRDQCANFCLPFHSSEWNKRGPTSIRRGIIWKTDTLLHGLPSRVRKPFSFKSLTIWE
jgi:hypothetical protein